MAIKKTQYSIHNTRYYKGKRILITAGPTWVAIDKVRVISNTASGKTGIILAKKLNRLGAKVTLLLGPADLCCPAKGVRLVRFRFFDELSAIIKRELKNRKYDIIIHSAAVADYRPVASFRGKIKSGLKNARIILKPTSKIIDSFRKYSRSARVIGFKFEPQAKKQALLTEASLLMQRAKLDLVVANTLNNKQYLAFLVGRESSQGPFHSREEMSGNLIKLL